MAWSELLQAAMGTYSHGPMRSYYNRGIVVGASPSGIFKAAVDAARQVQSKADAHIRAQAGQGAKKSVMPLIVGGAAATVLAVLILRPPTPKL